MSAIRFMLTAAVVLGIASGTTRAADPAAAKLLTADAKGFVHVRVGDVWSADVAKQLRAFVAQAGPDLLADFDSRFYPTVSDVESLTVVLFDPNFRDLLPAGRPTATTPVWVVTSKKPVDRDAILKTMGKSGRPKKHNGKEYLFDEASWSGVLVLDEHSFAYAAEDSVVALLGQAGKSSDTPLAALLVREADKHPATFGVNMIANATPGLMKGIPQELQPLFKAKTFVATLDLKPKTTVTAAFEFGNAAEAKDGLKAAQEAVQLARGQIGNALTFVEQKAKRDPAKPPAGIQAFPEAVGHLLAVAGLKQLDALLGAMPIDVKGNAVQASLELDSVLPGGSTAVSIAAVAIAIGISSEGFRLVTVDSGDYYFAQRERNLASIAKAIDKYAKDKGHYPPPAILDKDGKPLLSWRVAILPYLENVYIGGPFDGKTRINTPKDLYDLFKLDEPWDGPNNKKFIERLPSVYQAPYNVLPYSQTSIGKTLTLAVAGKGAIFDPAKKVTEADVRDGLKHTLLLLELEEPGQAVYWTKPADVALTAEGKLPADGPSLMRRFAAVYADESAHTLVNGLDAKTFLAIVTRDGNEKVDEKVIRPEPVKPPPPAFPK